MTMLAPDLNALVNSDILRNLCPPPAPELAKRELDSCRGAAIGTGWSPGARNSRSNSSGSIGRNSLGFEYYLIDDGWRDWRDGDKGQWENMKDVGGLRAHAKS